MSSEFVPAKKEIDEVQKKLDKTEGQLTTAQEKIKVIEGRL